MNTFHVIGAVLGLLGAGALLLLSFAVGYVLGQRRGRRAPLRVVRASIDPNLRPFHERYGGRRER